MMGNANNLQICIPIVKENIKRHVEYVNIFYSKSRCCLLFKKNKLIKIHVTLKIILWI